MVVKSSAKLQASVISALLLVSTISIIQSGTAQSEDKFTADLQPREGSSASGKATFELQGDEAVLYSINGTGLKNITNIAISENTTSGRGPDVVTIYSDVQSGKMTPEGDSIAKGNFTASDLQGPLEGKTLGDFVEAIIDGKLFLRVSTPDYELGEIYGDVTAGGNGGNATAGDNGDNGDNGGNGDDATAD